MELPNAIVAVTPVVINFFTAGKPSPNDRFIGSNVTLKDHAMTSNIIDRDLKGKLCQQT